MPRAHMIGTLTLCSHVYVAATPGNQRNHIPKGNLVYIPKGISFAFWVYQKGTFFALLVPKRYFVCFVGTKRDIFFALLVPYR